MTALAELPAGHPLRSRPLAEIGAQLRPKAGGAWKPVLPHWRIARAAYNDLGPAWTDTCDWQADADAGAARTD